MTPEVPINDTALKRHLDELVVFGLIGSTLIQAASAAMIWGDWARVLTIVAAWFGMGAVNWAITAFAFPRVGGERAEDLRLIPNVLFVALAGHASGWSVITLLFIPFAAVLIGGLQTGRPTGRMMFLVIATSGIALLDGAVPVVVASLTGMAIFWHLVGLAHTRFARQLLLEREKNLAEITQANEKVRVAQQSAIANEKLASIGMLAAGVAHEINNPMCFVTANVRSLMEQLATAESLSPELREYRDDILPATLDGIRRVNSIVGDMRRFARGETEQSTTFDLVAEVESAVRISRSQLKAGQVLDVELKGTPVVWGMPVQIGQVALNLIVNAIQASSDSSKILVSVGSHGGDATFAIRDQGIGMSPEVLGHLFLPFFTTKEVGKGTGLGLAVAHGIVKAHGGRIEVASEPGKGSCFEVFLPSGVGPTTLPAR